jgi:hypothetical protein
MVINPYDNPSTTKPTNKAKITTIATNSNGEIFIP